MSAYYRFWEFGEAHVPFGSRAPDITGIARDNLFLFSGAWWIGHALFFIAGCSSVKYTQESLDKLANCLVEKDVKEYEQISGMKYSGNI